MNLKLSVFITLLLLLPAVYPAVGASYEVIGSVEEGFSIGNYDVSSDRLSEGIEDVNPSLENAKIDDRPSVIPPPRELEANGENGRGGSEIIDVIVTLETEPLALRGSSLEKMGLSDGTYTTLMDSHAQKLENLQRGVLEAMERNGLGFTLKKRYDHILNGFAGQLPLENLERLKSLENVVSVVRDGVTRTLLNESGPLIRADVVKATGYRGDGVTIAIVDTGVDATHPSLDDLDDSPVSNDPKVVAFQDFTEATYDDQLDIPYDDFGHGTHVSSIAVGTAGDSDFEGVAPGAWLVSVKSFNYAGVGTDSNVIAGIEWVVENMSTYGIKILSLSVGKQENGDGTHPMEIACDNAVAAGITVVVSSGNSGQMGDFSARIPSSAKSVISVGAVDNDENMAYFSSMGPTTDFRMKPEIVAPGVNTIAANAVYDGNRTTMNYNDTEAASRFVGDDYFRASGTSMAAPHVAGTLALIVQRHPSWDAEKLKSAVLTTARGLGHEANEQGLGLVDAARAVNAEISLRTPVINFGLIGEGQGVVTKKWDVAIDWVVDYDVSITLVAGGGTGYSASLDKQSMIIQKDHNYHTELTVQINTDSVALGWNQGVITITRGVDTYRAVYGFFIGTRLTIEFYRTSPVHFEMFNDSWILKEYPAQNPPDAPTICGFIETGYFDFFTIFYSTMENAYKLIIKENVLVRGDTKITISDLSAQNRVDMDPVDRNGNVIHGSNRGKQIYTLVHENSRTLYHNHWFYGDKNFMISDFSADYRLEMTSRAQDGNNIYEMRDSTIGLTEPITFKPDCLDYLPYLVTMPPVEPTVSTIYLRVRDIYAYQFQNEMGEDEISFEPFYWLRQNDVFEIQASATTMLYVMPQQAATELFYDGEEYKTYHIFRQFDLSDSPLVENMENEPPKLGRSALLRFGSDRVVGHALRPGFPESFHATEKISMGQGTLVWAGRFANDETLLNLASNDVYIKSMASTLVVRDQFYGNQYKNGYDVPFTLNRSGVVILDDNLGNYAETESAGWPGDINWRYLKRYNIPVSVPGSYILTVNKNYTTEDGNSGKITVASRFDTTLADKNPPTFTHFHVLREGVENLGQGAFEDEFSAGETYDIRFGVDPVDGNIESVVAYYDYSGTPATGDIHFDGSEYNFTLALPAGAQSEDISIKIFIEDDSQNSLTYTIGTSMVETSLRDLAASAITIFSPKPYVHNDEDVVSVGSGEGVFFNITVSNRGAAVFTDVSVNISIDGINIDSVSGVIFGPHQSFKRTVFWNNPTVGKHTVELGVEEQAGELAYTNNIIAAEFYLNRKPEILPVSDQTATEDVPFGITITASDDDPAGIRFADNTDLFDIEETTGIINFTPLNEDVMEAGDAYEITIIVTDSYGSTNITNFNLEVINTNDAPAITSTPVINAVEDGTYTYQVVGHDDDSLVIDPDEVLSYSLKEKPAGMTIDAGSGLILWHPTNIDVPFTHNVTVEVTDDKETGSQTFNITVLNVNDPVSITSIPKSDAVEGVEYAYKIEVHDDDLDVPIGESISFILTDAPAGMIVNSTGFVRWTPSNDQAGTVRNVIIEVSDGDVTAIQSFQILITSINNPPFWLPIPSTATIPEDSYDDRLIDLLDFVVDIDDPYTQLIFSIDYGSQQGVIPGFISSGRYMGVDAKSGSLNDNWTGVVFFSVNVTDSGGLFAASNIFRIVVEAANDEPCITSQPAVVREEDEPISRWVDLLWHVTDADTPWENITFQISSDQYFDFEIHQNGSLTIIPKDTARNYAGTRQVVFSASDGEYTSFGSVKILTTPVKDAPLFKSLPTGLSVKEDGVNNTLIDLYQYILDVDTPIHELELEVISNTKDGVIGVKIYHDRFLSVDTHSYPEGINWSGKIEVELRIVEESGLFSNSGPLGIYIEPVEDSPVWETLPRVYLKENSINTLETELTEYVTDSDTIIDFLGFSVVGISHTNMVSVTISEDILTIKRHADFEGIGNSTVTLDVWDGTYNSRASIEVVLYPEDVTIDPGNDENGSSLFLDAKILTPMDGGAVAVGIELQFEAFLSTDAGWGFSWSMGDGEQKSLRDFSHVFQVPGIKNITLTVTDSDGNVDVASISIRADYDTDSDGVLNFIDDDDDNDGVVDGQDTFPLTTSEWEDSDGDGIGNNADFDDDNDGVPDEDDFYPKDSTRSDLPRVLASKDEGNAFYYLLAVIVAAVLGVAVLAANSRRQTVCEPCHESPGPEKWQVDIRKFVCPRCTKEFKAGASEHNMSIQCPHCGISGKAS